MYRVLITGSNSFVGNNYSRYALSRQVSEISLINHDPDTIDFRGYDVVLHLVAIVHQSKKIPKEEYFRVNRDLCLRTARKAKKDGVKQFIFLSTVKVYGKYSSDKGPWNENSQCNPVDAYGKSKFEAEKGLKHLEDNDFIVSIVRTPLVYGEGVRANMLSIIRLVNKFPVLPFRNVHNSRRFTYTKNLVGFIDRIIERRASGIFIAMDMEPLSTTDLVNLLAKHLGRKVFLFYVPQLLVNILQEIMPNIFERLYGSFEMDNSLTIRILDYTPVYSSEEGIREMCQVYLGEQRAIL